MAPCGGSRGAQNEFFLGLKPTQDPMNNVFEQKKSLGKIFFRTPGTPDRKCFRTLAGPGRPGRARGQPKGGQNRSVGLSNPSKTVRHPHGTWERWGRPARNSSSSQSYDQNTFFGLFGGVWAVFGAGWARDYVKNRYYGRNYETTKLREYETTRDYLKTGKNGRKLKIS